MNDEISRECLQKIAYVKMHMEAAAGRVVTPNEAIEYCASVVVHLINQSGLPAIPPNNESQH